MEWRNTTAMATSSVRIAPLHYRFVSIKVYLHIIISVAVLSKTTHCQRNDFKNYYVGCYAVDGNDVNNIPPPPSTIEHLDDCMEFCERKHWNFAIWTLDSKCRCSNKISSSSRHEDGLCNLDCTSTQHENAWCGRNMQRYYLTNWGRRTMPLNLHLINATENTLTIAWSLPNRTQVAPGHLLANSQVEKFRIQLKAEQSYSALSSPSPSPANYTNLPQFIVRATDTHQYEITNLHPATVYNISVESICSSSADSCGIAYLTASTLLGVPSPLPLAPRILQIKDSKVRLLIPPVYNDNGPVSKILIIVHRIDQILSQEFDADLLDSWQHAEESGLPYYIAAELPYNNQLAAQNSLEFIVGDGKQYGNYTNPPIDTKNSTWAFSLGVVSTLNGITKIAYQNVTTAHDQQYSQSTTLDNFSYATFAPGAESIIALTVVCCIFGLCLVLSIVSYFYLRYRNGQILAARANCHEMTMQQPIIDSSDYVIEDKLPNTDSFKEQLNLMVSALDASKKIARKQLRMNVNYVIADGIYGEVVSGVNTNPLLANGTGANAQECQIHVLALDDLNSADQAKLLREFNNICKLKRHDNIIDFFGVSATCDWFYVVFEHQTVTLKRRLIDSRCNTNASNRLSALSEQLILQWIYEIASAMEYLGKCKVVHKKLCSHNIYVTEETKLKLAIFGPISYVNEDSRSKVDLMRWLAPEVLRYQRYSPKSDIWAFGVVAWECCTLGATPYLNSLNSSQLFEELRNGKRLTQPAFVYRDLYQMLLNCWCLEANERTNFEDITLSVRQLMTSPLHALSFDKPSIDGNIKSPVDLLPTYNPQLEMQI